MAKVCISGSLKFFEDMQAFAQELPQLGISVYCPRLESSGDPRKDVFDFLAEVKAADVLFVYNPNGYCGNSVTTEIGYATGLGKPVYALCHDTDPNREVFYKNIISNAKSLAEVL